MNNQSHFWESYTKTINIRTMLCTHLLGALLCGQVAFILTVVNGSFFRAEVYYTQKDFFKLMHFLHTSSPLVNLNRLQFLQIKANETCFLIPVPTKRKLSQLLTTATQHSKRIHNSAVCRHCPLNFYANDHVALVVPKRPEVGLPVLYIFPFTGRGTEASNLV